MTGTAQFPGMRKFQCSDSQSVTESAVIAVYLTCTDSSACRVLYIHLQKDKQVCVMGMLISLIVETTTNGMTSHNFCLPRFTSVELGELS